MKMLMIQLIDITVHVSLDLLVQVHVYMFPASYGTYVSHDIKKNIKSLTYNR